VIGGAEQSTLYLIDGLKKTNHFTTLYTCELPGISETKNFNIHLVHNAMSFFFPYNYRIWRDFRKLYKSSEKEDVIIINGGGLMLDEINVDSRVIVITLFVFGRSYNLEYVSKFTGG